jgi:hypothetical protein
VYLIVGGAIVIALFAADNRQKSAMPGVFVRTL